jgi:transcription elongation factor Elf1
MSKVYEIDEDGWEIICEGFPCPFCDGTDLYFHIPYADSEICTVKCEACGAQAGYAENKEQAELRWTDRRSTGKNNPNSIWYEG